MAANSPSIEVRDLTKAYGKTVAVDHLSFDVHPGRVTGFLGPNGAGKSTTLRMILGLDNPTAGSALINGRPFAAHRKPLFEVGALLDPKAFHPGRSAGSHLRCLALANGIDRRRVDRVLDLVGLTAVASRRAGGFSLGMGQRLGLASALLGDPAILILDEPINGLDPEGVLWIRTLLRSLAAEGRTVLVSSHLMSEMALTAEHLVVIGQGRLLADDSVEAVVAASGHNTARVRSPQARHLAALLAARGATPTVTAVGELTVTGFSTDDIGDLAAANAITIHELSFQRASLEDAFMDLTRGSVQYRTGIHATAACTEESAYSVDRPANSAAAGAAPASSRKATYHSSMTTSPAAATRYLTCPEGQVADGMDGAAPLIIMVPEAGHYPQSQRPDITTPDIISFAFTVNNRA